MFENKRFFFVLDIVFLEIDKTPRYNSVILGKTIVLVEKTCNKRSNSLKKGGKVLW